MGLTFVNEMEMMQIQTLNNDRKFKCEFGNVTSAILRDVCRHDILCYVYFDLIREVKEGFPEIVMPKLGSEE